jgi:hypothetical protein
MTISNKYSSWYSKYKKDEKPKAPYRIVKIEHDIGVPVSGLENVRIDAYSPAQARFLFLKKYPKLQDYLNMGFQIEAELDEEILRQRKQLAEMERQREEERIQNAWWNND